MTEIVGNLASESVMDAVRGPFEDVRRASKRLQREHGSSMSAVADQFRSIQMSCRSPVVELVEQQRRQLELLMRSPVLEMMEKQRRQLALLTRSPIFEMIDRLERQRNMAFSGALQATRPNLAGIFAASEAMRMNASIHQSAVRILASSGTYSAFTLLEARRNMLAVNTAALRSVFAASEAVAASLASVGLAGARPSYEQRFGLAALRLAWAADTWPAGEPATDGPPEWEAIVGVALREFRVENENWTPREPLQHVMLAAAVLLAQLYLPEEYRTPFAVLEFGLAIYLALRLVLKSLDQ
jgi:hypothetical protein